MADDGEKSYFDSLSAKHQAFVLAYIKERHAGTAYGVTYSNAKRKPSPESCAANGHRLLKKDNIRAAVAERLNILWENRREEIGRVFDELSALAFADIRNVMKFSEDGTFSVADLSGVDTRAVKKLKIRKEPSKKIGNNIVEGADIIEIELYDKKAALSEMAEILSMKSFKIEAGLTIRIDNDDNDL